jgi:UDP-N-acetyl-D-glucosamine dehydrogenase
MSSSTEAKIQNGTAKICIIGLGYVGLPLAVSLAQVGYRVIGYDMQQNKVDAINQCQSYILGISNESLFNIKHNGLFSVTADSNQIKGIDIFIICVPTPLTKNKEPDLSYVISTSNLITNLLTLGQLVILESTTYPGTTRGVVKPILESSGKIIGKDLFLAYSPERIDPANKDYNIINTPKLVGGITPKCTELACLIYSKITQSIVPVSNPEVAEMAKIFENVYRSINISLVNELAKLCEAMDVSVWQVISAASSKPYGFVPFYPGPGIGGHCIPLDPHYLASKAKEFNFRSRFIEVAADINEQMPLYIARQIVEMLNLYKKSVNGAKILILGIAYKKDVPDTRESPSIVIIDELLKRKAEVYYHDSMINGESSEVNDLATATDISQTTLASMDCVIIATNHSNYDFNFIIEESRLVYDCRGATSQMQRDNVYRLGEKLDFRNSTL